MDDRTPLEKIFSALDQQGKTYRTTGAGKYIAQCPGHDDKTPSLSITQDGGGKVLLHCFGGCTLEAILNALGLTKKDLFPDNGRQTMHTPTVKPKQIYANLDEAARAIASQVKGTAAGRWKYQTADGGESFWMLRFDLPGGDKTYRPIHRNGAGYIQGDPAGKLPLYGLAELNGQPRVFLVEGEKCADAARSINLTATTSAHGAQSPHKSDWQPLAAREAIVLPDNDAPGEHYAQDVIALLRKIDPAIKIKIARLPDLPEGGDIVDFLESRDAVEPEALRGQIEALADAAAFVEPTEPKKPLVSFPMTDSGAAEMLAQVAADDLLFNYNSGKWLRWTGRRWTDIKGEAHARRLFVTRAARGLRTEALNAPNRDLIEKWARQLENTTRITNALHEARGLPEFCRTANEFDADPWLFNAQNGTVNLKTGALQPHSKTDLITKISPVEFIADAQSPVWDNFLVNVTGGDNALAEFLQRAAGYTATGLAIEEKLFFCFGPTATGKSSFIEALKNAYGDYGITADFSTFLDNKGGIRNDLAQLAGARFVCSLEVDDGRKLAEAVVKMLTGSDTIRARFLYQESFEFLPQFSLFLAANHCPRVSDDDDACWRRILRLPFVHTVPEDQRDPEVKRHLRDPKGGGPAVLRWLVAGCLDWQQQGLNIPDAVTRSTADYRQEQNPLADFVADECIVAPGLKVSVTDLRAAYDTYCTVNKVYPLNPRHFNERLAALGCTRKAASLAGNIVKAWEGIGLKAKTENGLGAIKNEVF